MKTVATDTSHATIIVNPVSGKGNPALRRKQITSFAKENHWVGRYRETTKEKSAEVLAREEIKKGVTHLVICGGDGSIMEVLAAVMHKKVTLGIVPLGTGNLFARNLGIPLDTREAVNIAFEGNPQKLDIGNANGQYFSIIAGIGLDAEIMHGADREMKDRLGLFAYLVSAVKNFQNRAHVYQVTLDDKKPFRVRAKTIMASNMGKVMGGVEVVPSADPQNGSLQLGIVKSNSVLAWLNLIWHGIFATVDTSPNYMMYSAKHIEIHSVRQKIMYQCDGNDFPPTNSLIIDIFPKSVTINGVPKNKRA